MSGANEDVIVGIDLGTTYSLVAVLDGDAPTLVPNALGEVLTPSAVSVDLDGSILVGAAAKARATTHPNRTALVFKRDMGTRRTHALEGHPPLSAEQLSAFVLLALKHDAEAFLGRAVNRAVITVPAYFGDLQRQATKDAAAIAGLTVERIINEPTAAALAYGLAERDASLRIAVLDLGGGTFDVTILELDDGVLEIRSSAGDARLGGEDFTDAIAALLRSRIEERHGPIADRAKSAPLRIREHAEQAKKRLAVDERTTITIHELELGAGPVEVSLELTRDDVTVATEALMTRLRAPITRALRDARMLPSAVDEVLLVGGATRMPWVVALAESTFQRAPKNTLPPDEAVALGAAVQAGLHAEAKAVEDLVVTDVAPFTLGIETSGKHGDVLVAGLFAPILERGTVIPASRVERFHTIADHQTEILVDVYQGEHSLCADNTKLGSLKVKGIPKKRAGESTIDVRFTYDLSGILEVDVTVTGSSKQHSLVLERNPGQLTKAQVEEARRAMAKIKFHPREALPNRTALARAEALFVELRGEERQFLGGLTNDLRFALERQEPAGINAARIRLMNALESLRRG